MAKPPVPLKPENQLRYDELYDLFGQAEADRYALGVSKTETERAGPPGGVTPAPPPPSVVTAPPVNIQLVTGPGGRIQAVPVGMEPRTPPPPMTDIKAFAPSRQELVKMGEQAATAFTQRRVSELMATGMDMKAAEEQATREAQSGLTTPRVGTEFGSRPAPGYSELAVRGQELLPRMGAIEATGQALMPQVLETAEQAEGRRRFEKEMAAAKARLKERAAASGKSIPDQVQLEVAGNFVRAQQIAQQMYENPTMEQIGDVRASLDAPIYAAYEELRGVPPAQVMSKFGKDVLRGLTTEERFGRLVETRGAAALRGLGGLSRYAIRGAEEAIVRPVTAGVVAALDPNVTYSDLMQMEEAEREAGGGARVVSGPGVQYEKGAETRRKLDTGDYLRDTAYEIATGRSAVDDYIDAGVPSGAATVLGIATEFAIPATPLGWATDVAPAFASAARAAGAGRAMDALAASRVGTVGRVIKESPEIMQIRSFARAQGGKVAEAVESSPVFANRLSDATSLRKNLTEIMAREGADVGQVERLLTAEGVNAANRVGTSMYHLGVAARQGGKFADDVIEALKGLPDYDEFIRTVKPVSYGIEDIDIVDAAAMLAGKNIKVKSPAVNRFIDQADEIIKTKTAQAAQAMKQSKVPATRVAYVQGSELGALSGTKARDIQPAREAVAAEVVDAIPTDNYVFLTNNMMVNKSLLKNPKLKEIIKTATDSVAAGRSYEDVERAVEQAVRSNFAGEVATPAGVSAPRGPGFVEAPRGGIERLQQPVSRRVVAIETVQDVVRAVRSAFSDNVWKQTTSSFQAASEGRLTPQVSRFMTETKGNLDSIPLSLESTMKRLAAAGVEDPIDAYISARVAATMRGVNPSVFNAQFIEIAEAIGKGEISLTSLNAERLAELTAQAAADMVIFRLEAGNLRAVLGEDWRKFVDEVVASNMGRSARDTYQTSVDVIRSRYPQLKGVGLGRRIGSESANDTMATVQWIASEEARAIFRKNVKKHFGELVGTADEVESISRGIVNNSDTMQVGTTNVKDAVQRAINSWFDSTGADAVRSMVGKAGDDIAGEFIYSKNFARPTDAVMEDFSGLRKAVADELRSTVKDTRAAGRETVESLTAQRDDAVFSIREVMRGQAKQQVDDAVDEIMQDFAERIQSVRDEEVAALAEARVDIDRVADQAVTEFILQTTRKRLLALDSQFSKQFALSGFNENVAIETLSDLVDLPLPPQLKEVLVKYFGSIDDLKKMTGILGDQATLGSRSISSGMFTKFWETTTQIADTFRGMNAGGLTAGNAMPNIRYHAVNFLTAPLIQAFTSPKFLLESVAQGLINIPARGRIKLGTSVNPAGIRAGRVTPDAKAMTTTTGISYTYRDLNRMLDEMSFGMTEQNYLLGGRQLEDIAIAAKAPPGVLKLNTDTIIRSLGVKGTGYWARFASSIDRQWRQTAFLVALRNGQTPDQALNIARNAFLDYGKIPDSVRQSVGKYMQFFSWFALSNAEWLRAFLTTRGGSNIAKIANAQRDAHRQWGDYLWEDDSTKKRLWSSFVGNFDGAPAFDVGPENPAVGPLFDTSGPLVVSLLSAAGSDEVDFSDAVSWSNLEDIFIDKASGPIINYLKQIGLLGKRPLGDLVPAKVISFHMMQGPEHFAEWSARNGITPVPYEKRRPGTETFYGEQFMFVDDAAKKRWAFDELKLSLIGFNRLIGDMQQMAVLLGITPPGMDAKRFENANTLDILKFLMGGTKLKGRDEYDAYRSATQQIIRELRSGEGVERTVTE